MLPKKECLTDAVVFECVGTIAAKGRNRAWFMDA